MSHDIDRADVGRTSAVTLAIPLPEARCPVSVRVATAKDVPFIDALQKMHTHMVGWSPRKQLETNVESGHVLIAEAPQGFEPTPGSDQPSTASNQPVGRLTPIGYCIGRDQYMKRDDVGIVYQLNVMPILHRHLVGATLVKACFERAAYGCRLFCCWCAQDIQANYFWESIGFVPLAFRCGSRGKQRIHIFWQKRIREGDESTPLWFPSQTSAGAVREDRLVFPIPPDTHWRDAKPVILPGDGEKPPQGLQPLALPGNSMAVINPAARDAAKREERKNDGPKVSTARTMAVVRSQSKHLKGLGAGKAAVLTSGGIRYVDRGDYQPDEQEIAPKKKKRPRKKAQKHDRKHVAAARELRDRFLEQINAGLLLPSGSQSKYDVSRQLEGGFSSGDPEFVETRRLTAE